MYYQYFGLTEAPFSIAVNPRYLFMSARHRDALAHLLYGVGAGGGFILLTGEVGTGKTTINRCLLEQLPDDTDIAIILNPALNAMELLASACDELGIDYDRDQHTLKTLTDELHRYLLANYERGRKTVLLIDEAQHLDFDVLEQIRLLTNLETNSEKLLQIILIGQPELAQMLARPELRQLNQRITARYNLEPLNLEETGAYISHRLQVAGMSPDRVIFPPRVVKGIYRATRGIPRVINVLCDRVLLGAYGRNRTQADGAMLRMAAREVLGEEGEPGGAAHWPLAVAGGLALVVVLVLGGGWLLLGGSQPPTGPVAQADPVQSPALSAGQPEAVAPVPGELAAPAAGPVEEPPETLTGATLARALLPPGESMRRLWSLYPEAPPPAQPCPSGIHHGLVCADGEAGTWDELARFDRPLSITLVTPDRFSAEALLLGFDGRDAWLLAGEAVVPVDLARLGPLWTGAYRFLWRPPEGFQAPLSLGDDSAVVAAVANLFARLDGQPRALADTRFNSALEQRVRMFQRDHDLVDDGVVGVRTLLRLNELLGIDVTAAQARHRLQAETTAGAAP